MGDEVESRDGTGRPDAGGLDLVGGLLLVGATLRVMAAVISAAIGWAQTGGDVHRQHVGYSLEGLGGFGDGPGVTILLAALGVIYLRPTRARTLWLYALFVLSAAGAVVAVVGTVMLYAGLYTLRVDLSHIVATGGFTAAYGIVATAGAVACHRLRDRPEH